MPTKYESDRGNRRSARRRAKQAHDSINWDIVNSQIIIRLIQSATRAGGAVRFGGTTDHGALSLGVYGDGEPYTEHFRDSSELEEFAEDLINVFNGMADANE